MEERENGWRKGRVGAERRGVEEGGREGGRGNGCWGINECEGCKSV